MIDSHALTDITLALLATYLIHSTLLLGGCRQLGHRTRFVTFASLLGCAIVSAAPSIGWRTRGGRHVVASRWDGFVDWRWSS